MPTIEVVFEDLQRLVGKRLPRNTEQLNDLLSFVKGDVESFNENEIKIEIKDGNRPDLWNVEGIARELRGALGIEVGLKKYMIEEGSGVEVKIDPRLEEIRPYIACAVIKGVELDDETIRALMHLQDKLDLTYGRGRKRTSIGLYNFDLITPPLHYNAAKPDEVSFVPLGFNQKMTLKEILEKHPKGIEFGHIVTKHEFWPLLTDSNGAVLSFPPIINSNDLGRITKDVNNILVETTGTVHQAVINILNIVTLSLADRGGRIYSVKINYPYGEVGEIITPRLRTQQVCVENNYVSEVLGLSLKSEKVAELLKKARYGITEIGKDHVLAEVPCYRIDIIHPVDVVEDIAIMYGFNNIKPLWPQLVTAGELSPREHFSNLLREIMIGLGFQEILSFTMSNPENLFNKMSLKPERVIEVSNPKTLKYTCLRNWLTPSLIELLSNNIHVEYPQKIFELGECVVIDEKMDTHTKDVRKLACITMHVNANFTEVKGVVDSLFLNIGGTYMIHETRHPSFIDGRVGKILIDKENVGIIGEINPRVLEAWKLEIPAAGFEVNVDTLFQRLAKQR